MQFDVAALRRQTQAAIDAGRLALQAEEEQRRLAAEAWQREAEAKAQGILAQLPAKVQQAVAKGRFECGVMQTYGIPDYDSYKNQGNPVHLRGAAKIVWEGVIAAGLTPVLVSNHDGFGEKSWHDMIAKW